MTTNQKNEGVDILLGNPKTAIIKFSIPIMVSMIAHAVFQLSDIIWVSGLGAGAISAVGFFGPLVMISIAIVSGITVGGGTSISKRIGAEDITGADKIVVHMFILILTASLLFIVPLIVFSRPIFLFLGAEQTIELTLSYSRLMILNFFFQFMLEGATTLLRSEGDSKRAMRIYLFVISLNFILDPIFIYLFDFGVVGAAWASVTSMIAVSIVWIYWLIIKRTTFVTIRLKGFRPEKIYFKDILKLGLPVSLGQFFFGLMITVNTKIVAIIGGSDGVAVYQGGLRFMGLIWLPLLAIASALTTIIGAAWGSKSVKKIKEAFQFSVKLTLLIEGVLVIVTIVAAPLITLMFTWSKDTARLTDDFVTFFRVFTTGILAGVILILTESLFVGVGQGAKKLQLNVLRSVVFVVPSAIIFGAVLEYGLPGYWTGISIGNWLAAVVAIIMSINFFSKFEETKKANKPAVVKCACQKSV